MTLRNLIILLFVLTNSHLFADIQVLTRFEPSRVAIGNASKYVIQIIESDTHAQPPTQQINSIPLQQIDGLILRNGQTSSSQQTKIINGRAEFNITQQLTFDAIPQRTGSYTIPSYTIDFKGQQINIPAATLNVVERSADATPMTDELVFLALEAPDKLYVGQATGITLKLFVANGVTLRGLNSFEQIADGFTLSGGPSGQDATESVEIVNGRRYSVYSWPIEITPIRSGKQALNFYFELSVLRPNRQNARNSPFGQSVFDDFFGRVERMGVYTKPTQIDVLPLPANEQPESFSGAIGRFNIEISADAESTRVSEPIMLSLKISGQGNFARIQGPELPESDGWRNYPPETIFAADDSQPLAGAKRFDYIFVPEKTGTLKLPEVSFSFFDPEAEKYVELTGPALKVEVTPAAQSAIPAPAPNSTESTATKASTELLTKTLSPEERLLTLDYQPKKGRPPGKAFIPMQGLLQLNGIFLIAVSALGLFIYRRTKIRQSPDYPIICNAKRELKTALKEIAVNDASTVYSNAQRAIRMAATIRTRQNLQSAELVEVEAQLRQLNLPETLIEQTRDLFQAADNQRFSGQNTQMDLSGVRKQLKTILKALV